MQRASPHAFVRFNRERPGFDRGQQLIAAAEPSHKWIFSQYVSKNLALHLSVKIRNTHDWNLRTARRFYTARFASCLVLAFCAASIAVTT